MLASGRVLNLVYGEAYWATPWWPTPVAGISFTGRRPWLAHPQCRLGTPCPAATGDGRKNPLVVLDDCDPEFAASVAAIGGFGLTGQACTATSRVICTPGIYEGWSRRSSPNGTLPAGRRPDG